MSLRDVHFHMAAQALHESDQRRVKSARRRSARRTKRVLGIL